MHDSGTMRESLDWVIDGYPDELLCLLKKQAGKRLPAQREKMIPKLAEALLRPERVDAMLAGADGGELALLAFMARAGGQPRIGAVDWWLRRRGGAEPSTTLQSLVERGLVFHVASTSKPTRDSNDDDAGLDPEWTLLPAGRLWVPDEIAAKAVDIEPEPPLPVAPGSHEKRRAAPGEVIRELFLLARFIDERRPEVLSTSRSLGQTDFVDLAAAVDDGDRYKHARRLEEAPGLMWLVAIALQAEVAAISEQRLRPCAHADEFFSVGLQRQASWLLDAAIAQTRWGELETSASVVLEKPPALSRDGSDLPGPGRRVGARRKLVDVLARIATPGTWHSVGAFAEGMMRANPDFLIRRHAPRWNGAVTEPEYRGILSLGASDPEPVGMWDGWSAVEGVFIEQFIVEALARIGLVEVGDGADGVVFRITELGAAALSSDDAPIDEPDDAPGRFFVQPNFEIIADGGGDNIGTVWRLSRV
ncbi:MAG TPA: hypothetical protein QGH10_15460, partial [Armatimonadota bacterium]|nr:hypothetical protein [Armatimonadota bacterium]